MRQAATGMYAGIQFILTFLLFLFLGYMVDRKMDTGVGFLANGAVIGFLVGASAFGLRAAGVEVRGVFYFASATLYFMTFDYDERTVGQIAGMWLVAASGLALLGAYKWIAPHAGLPTLAAWSRWSSTGGSR